MDQEGDYEPHHFILSSLIYDIVTKLRGIGLVAERRASFLQKEAYDI